MAEKDKAGRNAGQVKSTEDKALPKGVSNLIGDIRIGDIVDSQYVVIGHGAKVVVVQGQEQRIPWMKPGRPEHFTGREAELKALSGGLRPGQVMTLCGPGGMGKTALASEAIWRLEEKSALLERFPDGLIWHSFYNRPEAEIALEQIATSYGEGPRPTPAEAARRALGGRKALLVLDGAEQAEDLAAVLEVRASCGVLITTRRPKDVRGTRVDVRPLPEAEELLEKVGEAQAVDERARHEICEIVGRLPLAVVLAGRYMAQQGEPASEYLSWLRATPLEALDHGERQRESVVVMLERNVAQLSEGARQAFAVTGLLALAAFQRSVVAAALEMDEVEIRRAADELVNYGLLTRSKGWYQAAHALVHSYARKRIQAPDGASQRLGTLYTELALKWGKEGLEGYAKLDGERPHFVRVLKQLLRSGAWKEVHNLAGAADGYLDVRGHWLERVGTCEAALEAARHLGDRHREAYWLGSLGDAYSNLGRVEMAIERFEQALVIAQEIGDRGNEGSQRGNLGTAYAKLGRAEKAIEHYLQALMISQETGDRRNEGAWLGNLGIAYLALGQVKEAIEHHRQALITAREIGDQEGEAVNLGNLGIAYRNLGQMDKAIEHIQQALTIQVQRGDRKGEAYQLGNLGNIYFNLGQMEKSLEHHNRALAVLREIGDRQGEGNGLTNLGNALLEMGQIEEAIEHYQKALVIAREIGDRRGEGGRLGSLGRAYRGLGEVEKAVEHYQQALVIAREIGDRRGEESQLGNLGLTYASQRKVQKAIDHYQQALLIAREIGDRRGEGTGLYNLGLVYTALRQVEMAIEHHQWALTIFEEINSPLAEEVRRRLEELAEQSKS